MNKSFWQGKRVVVTGGSGFLGSHFVSELLKLEANVTCSSYKKPSSLKKICKLVNLLDYDQTKDFLSDADVVINCAAVDGNTEFKLKQAARILDENSRIVSNILNAAKENHVKDVVLISSAEIYSVDAPSPIKEEYDYHQYNGHTPNGYVLSKRFAEILAELFEPESGLNIYLPRPSNIYGPQDHFDARISRVIPSFITKISNDEDIQIWGDGTQIRQFVHVTDVVRSVLTMVEKQATGKFNISTDEYISILDLAKLIGKLMKRTPKIHLDLSKSAGVQNRVLDVSKLNGIIKRKPKTLEIGLTETINWYQKHGNN